MFDKERRFQTTGPQRVFCLKLSITKSLPSWHYCPFKNLQHYCVCTAQCNSYNDCFIYSPQCLWSSDYHL